MAKQIINLGTVADDNTGDSPRVAGDKINDNFSEIYGVSGILKSNGSTTLSAAVSGTDYAPATSGTSILYGNGSGGFSNVTIGSGLSFSTGTLSSTATGTVTSVGVTVPSILSVSGSPITTSGTIAISLANQSANTVFAGPTTGSPAAPSFRALVLGDLPSGVGLTASTLAQFAATTSSQLAGVISDETGSGSLVFANTPTLVTPVLGVATATSINKVAITAPATGATLTIPDGVTFTGPSSSGTAVIQGAATGSGLTMATARLLGRTTASTGAIEEISIGSGLSMSAGTLSATGGGSGTRTLLFQNTADATWVNTTSNIAPSGTGSLTVSSFTANDVYALRIAGYYSGTGVFGVLITIGGTTVGAVITTIGTVTGQYIGTATGREFDIEAIVRIRTVSASGNVNISGRVAVGYDSSPYVVNYIISPPTPNSPPTVNLSGSAAFGLTLNGSGVTAAVVNQFTLEKL